MQYNRIFSTEDSYHPDITKMPQHLSWYPQGQPQSIPSIATTMASTVCDQLQALPQGKRVVFLKWILRYESYPDYGANVLDMFNNGGLAVSRAISMLRPFGAELRRRKIHLDGIWSDNEGGASNWSLTYDQIQSIFANPKTRAKMPPAIRALSPAMLSYTSPNFRNAVIAFNRWANQLLWTSLRSVMVGAGIFVSPPSTGGAPVCPPTSNFNIAAPTFMVYDYNGWPIDSFALDGRTSSPGCYLTSGNRDAGRLHDPRWNAFTDTLNMIRSCMARPNALVWPTIAWPDWGSAWVFEQMIAHMVRTGVNTSNGCSYIYWRDVGVNAAVEDPLMVQIFNRHDQPFAAQRHLPEIPLDSDSVTTAGYTTTYADFLANVT